MTKHKQHGIFYLLPKSKCQQQDKVFYFEEKFICNIIQTKWRSGKSILISCENKSQALNINKALWNFDQDSFLPHDLFGKNANDIPITIYWSQCCYNNKLKDVLINLMHRNIRFFLNFNEIIDFVPENAILKKFARIRYKIYQKTGFHLNVINASKFTNNN